MHLVTFTLPGGPAWIGPTLSAVGRAADEAAALDRFAESSATWEARYPTIVRLWGHASLAGEVTASRDV